MNSTIQKSSWVAVCNVEDVPENGGVCVKYSSVQIALFYFTRRNEWYASQNMCPHKKQMAISRGMLGSLNNEPKVACPFHKKTFSLTDGRCLNSDDCGDIKIYKVKVDNGIVYIDVSEITNQNKLTEKNCNYENASK